MTEIKLYENVNKEKLKLVLKCNNIPINDESNENDINWLDIFKNITLINYAKLNQNITYTQKNTNGMGRYMGQGLQSFPKEIRKYLSDNMYIDIDMVNCHPILIENILRINNIEIPILLKEYNQDKEATMVKYNWTDKKSMLYIINKQECKSENKEIQNFHRVLYTHLFNIFKKTYTVIEKETNPLGSFMALCLQDVENKVLMCMYKKCLELNVKVGVLIFDGMMIYKNSMSCDIIDLLLILEEQIESNLNYKVKLIEKSMETTWKPIEDMTPATILFNTCSDLGTNLDCKIANNISLYKGNKFDEISYPITSNYFDYMHQLKDKKCKEPLNYNIMVNDDTKQLECCISCKKCQQIHPLSVTCQNRESYELIKNNLQMHVTQNNIIINNYYGTPEIEEIEDVLIFDESISGNIIIDDLLKELIYKNLDSDYCNIIHELYKDKLKTCDNKWFVFESPIWKQIDKNPIEINNGMKKIVEYLKIIVKNNGRHKLISRKDIKKHIILIEKRLCRNNEDSIFSRALIKYFNDDNFVINLDKNKMLIAFNNGVYDITNGEFRLGICEDFLSMKLNYDYNLVQDSNEKMIFLDRMLDDILGDKEQKDYLLKAIASCLEGTNYECKFFINTGKGRNGKSLLFDFLGSVLGCYQCTMEPSFITKEREKSNEANEALIYTNNKRLILISEPNKRDLIRSDIMKKYTGDKKTTARANFKGTMEIDIGFKMFLLCNSIPLLDKCDNAEYERLAVIKYENHFVENPKKKNEKQINKKLLTILESYKNEMMNVLFRYYKLYKREKLQMPTKIINNTNIYKDKVKNGDDIYVFIIENLEKCEENDESKLKCKDIWDSYTNWCTINNKKRGKQMELEDSLEIEFDIEKRKCHNLFYYNVKIIEHYLL